jgi:hypothetical protein
MAAVDMTSNPAPIRAATVALRGASTFALGMSRTVTITCHSSVDLSEDVKKVVILIAPSCGLSGTDLFRPAADG